MKSTKRAHSWCGYYLPCSLVRVLNNTALFSAIKGTQDFKQELHDSFPTSYFAFPASLPCSASSIPSCSVLCSAWAVCSTLGLLHQSTTLPTAPTDERVNQKCSSRKTFCSTRLVCSRKRRPVWVSAVCLPMWESWAQRSPGLQLQTHTDSTEHCPHSHEELFCLTLPRMENLIQPTQHWDCDRKFPPRSFRDRRTLLQSQKWHFVFLQSCGALILTALSGDKSVPLTWIFPCIFPACVCFYASGNRKSPILVSTSHQSCMSGVASRIWVGAAVHSVLCSSVWEPYQEPCSEQQEALPPSLPRPLFSVPLLQKLSDAQITAVSAGLTAAFVTGKKKRKEKKRPFKSRWWVIGNLSESKYLQQHVCFIRY